MFTCCIGKFYVPIYKLQGWQSQTRLGRGAIACSTFSKYNLETTTFSNTCEVSQEAYEMLYFYLKPSSWSSNLLSLNWSWILMSVWQNASYGSPFNVPFYPTLWVNFQLKPTFFRNYMKLFIKKSCFSCGLFCDNLLHNIGTVMQNSVYFFFVVVFPILLNAITYERPNFV